MRTPEDMNSSLELKAGSWMLLVGPSSLNTSLLRGIAHLPVLVPAAQVQAQVGEHAGVHVLDGGNRFNGYTLARAAYGRQEILNRITVARAFTCYQMLALLESTPASEGPFMILDCCARFMTSRSTPGNASACCAVASPSCSGSNRPAEGWSAFTHPPWPASPEAVELLGLQQQSATDTFFFQPPPGAALPQQIVCSRTMGL